METPERVASQQVPLIVNDPPYGTERSYNGLRLALSLAKEPEVALRVFLMADAVRCAQRGQQTPQGYYNVERMLGGLVGKRVPIDTCGSCMDARGMTEEVLMDGVHCSSMAELTAMGRHRRKEVEVRGRRYPIATGSSGPSRTPRTWSRRRLSGPGGTASACKTKAVPGPGCSGSRRTPASICSTRGDDDRRQASTNLSAGRIPSPIRGSRPAWMNATQSSLSSSGRRWAWRS